jgi:hypothetical protein
MTTKSPLLITVLAAVLAGCASHQENVCQDIGDCSQGGSNDWITACKDEANALQDEANGAGCGSDFNGYFGCADSSYTCHGATALFPGCDIARQTLEACLTAATAGTSCAALDTAQAACGAPPPPPDPGTGLPPACTLARDCQARCYLVNVTDPCAPRVNELDALAACTASCVF